jgi:hypothetical protein
MTAVTDVMDSVVVRIIEAMHAGADAWEMPWRSVGSSGWPTNAFTGNRYRTGAVWVFERREWVVRLVPCTPSSIRAICATAAPPPRPGVRGQ